MLIKQIINGIKCPECLGEVYIDTEGYYTCRICNCAWKED